MSTPHGLAPNERLKLTAYVQIKDLVFGYQMAKQPLFSGLTGTFYQGWLSICGPNGCGKTTLLKLLGGMLLPQKGSISLRGTMAYVPQMTQEPPARMVDFMADYSQIAIRLRSDLGIDEDWIYRWDTLSIGERKKLQLADALAMRPEVLLIDEPTNHVDRETRREILAALKSYRGIGVLVSHDRLLLNELCDHTAFLDSGHLQVFATPYDTARHEWQQLNQNQALRRERLKGQSQKLARSIQKQSERINQGAAKLSKKGISSKDHDAKEKINLAKVTGADKSDSRKKHALEGRRQRLEAKIGQMSFKKNYDLGVFFGEPQKIKPVYIPEGQIKQDYLTVSHPNIVLNPGDKLAIRGANGAGKTTMLTAWLEMLTQPFQFAPQELPEQRASALWKELNDLPSEQKGKIMTLMSCLGSDPKGINEYGLPSPGVWQKIMIAMAIVNSVPLLVLDEPTNHMDLPAVELLEDALARFQGVLIFISHDDEFVASLATVTLTLRKEGARSDAILAYPRP